MRHPDIDYWMVMERRRDELAEAELARLITGAEISKRLNANQAAPSQSRRLWEILLLFAAQFLSLVGERMLDWSCRLQYRYTLLAADVTEQRPGPCES